MLQSLTIRDIVLIERLTVTFADGLCVLTGETGAGKSILLDSLGLALGSRADSGLVRHGADKGTVNATFEISPDHAVWAQLDEAGVEPDDVLMLKRTVSADGRSRAFINDQPVSATLLRTIGTQLVEVHGQFETRGLLNPAQHLGLLDAFADHAPLVTQTRSTYKAWTALRKERLQAEADLEQARQDEEYLRHMVEELGALAPQSGEEEALAAERQVLMQGEKLIEGLSGAVNELSHGRGVEAMLRGALRQMERVSEKAEGRFDEVIESLDKALENASISLQLLDRASNEVDLDPRHLEAIEERLFALRAAARKHNVSVDGLSEQRAHFEAQLRAVEKGDAALADLTRREAAARKDYIDSAMKLATSRRGAASELDGKVNGELAPLKLGGATFATTLEELSEDDWSASGQDRVAFEIATNPGAPLGPIAKVASGGELARFMLALKVVLANADPIPSLVFDEVDAGIGGATAAAVGERLGRLAQDFQVLVVTHSPQVAAQGNHHLRVSKAQADTGVVSTVETLPDADRTEEIARMISGDVITPEARAAASSLITGSAA